MNEVRYKVIISSDLNKILTLIPILIKNNKIIRHYINNNDFWHVELENGDHLICTPPEKLKIINIQITKLWIDKSVTQEVINKEIMLKYIGKKEDIMWI